LDDAVQLAAVDAAGRGDRLEPVMGLAALLDDKNPELRAASARALSLVTNVDFFVDWRAGTREARTSAAARWHTALERSRRAPRDAWLVTGFRGAGYDVREIHGKYGYELVRATADADHLSYNAQRTLMRLFDYRPPSLTWKKSDACLHWLRWMNANRERLRLDKPRRDIAAACAGAKG
jgi:hypothetical protein